MSYLLSILFVLASLGVVNGLLLSIYLIFKKQKRISDMYFGGLVLAISIRIGKSVFLYFANDVDKLVLQIGLSACIFIGPFFYFYMKSILRDEQKFKQVNKVVLITILVLVIVVGAIWPYRIYPEIWNTYLVKGIYAIWLFFVVLGIFTAKGLIKKALTDLKKLDGREQYLLAIILGMVFITSTYHFAFYIRGFTYLWGALAFSFIFYYLLWRTLRRNKSIVPKSVDESLLVNGKGMLKKVNRIMLEQKLFTNPKLKLDELATQTEMSKHMLSRLLNETYQYGFSQYVNEYRIKEAMQLIKLREDLSLEGIGYESGFNSRSSFFSTFKKIADCTPLQYKKSIERGVGKG